LRVFLGLVLGTLGYLGAVAVDRGLTRPWPDWARSVWAISLIVFAMAGVLLVVTGLGVLSREVLQDSYGPETPENRRITLWPFCSST
jgi:hypothetical protein